MAYYFLIPGSFFKGLDTSANKRDKITAILETENKHHN